MLEVKDLATPCLGGVSFTLDDGECVAVRGRSGAGKSLLLRALADLDPVVGQVALDGIAREAVSGPEWRRRVRYLAAEPGWWSERVDEHFAQWPPPGLERMLLSPGVAETPVSRLSTGERQRLALVRALERVPRVLLADEPTAALDAAATAAVEAWIAELRQGGMAVLWVSHDPQQAARVASRTLVVADGRVEEAA